VASNSRNTALNAYVAAVAMGGIATFVVAATAYPQGTLLGGRPLVFGLFVLLFVVGELRPLDWLSGRDGGEITASWTFSLGMLCVAPPLVSLTVVALASALLELRGKSVQRTVFNTAQVTVSLGASALVLFWLGAGQALWSGQSGPSLGWVGSVLLAGLVALMVNAVLTCTVLALSHELPLRLVVRDAISTDWAIDALLVGIAPVLVAVAVEAPTVTPMLLVVIVGVYMSAKVGLAHRYEATHDLLTGLPNRRMFFAEAAMSLRAANDRGRVLAVAVVDLDGFKEINDRLGHAVGDLALQHVATRLRTHRRSTDVVARLGGDEFAILLGGTIDADGALAAAKAILQSLSVPLDVDGVPVLVGGSVGLALFPEHGEDIDSLLSHADAAMYQAKTDQLGLHVYHGGSDRNGPTRLGLLAELRRALHTDDELVLHFQPKVELETETVCGVEALIRWNHPDRGLLAAAYFMPVAEQTELMDELTERVLRLAVDQAARWSASGIDVPIAVNVSARNLLQFRFPELVAGILHEAGVSPGQLELEVTENTVTSDPARAGIVLDRLKRLGVAIAVDDFGTGYSSLAHLRSLPLDAIKIDRSFIRDLPTNPGDHTIVRCVLDLATNLGLRVVAEGVEDGATLAILRMLGCPVAQGYYLGMPAPAHDIERLMSARTLRDSYLHEVRS
jgi:diguanylate cyclase (GGDEF)-like protein